MAKSSKTTGKNTRTSASSNGKKTTTASRSNGKTSSSKEQTHEGPEGKEELMKLFEHALKDMFWVEKALTRSIPKMVKKANSEELINALEDHLDVTENQVSKLERVFAAIDKTPRAKKCVGMEGILKEGEELMEEFAGPAIDAAIIAAAQKVEHYEMSSYMSMITLARTLDMVKEAAILEEVLAEEMEADKLLANIAATSAHEMILNEA